MPTATRRTSRTRRLPNWLFFLLFALTGVMAGLIHGQIVEGAWDLAFASYWTVGSLVGFLAARLMVGRR